MAATGDAADSVRPLLGAKTKHLPLLGPIDWEFEGQSRATRGRTNSPAKLTFF